MYDKLKNLTSVWFGWWGLSEFFVGVIHHQMFINTPLISNTIAGTESIIGASFLLASFFMTWVLMDVPDNDGSMPAQIEPLFPEKIRSRHV